MFADLPPSSRVTFFTVPDASCMMRRPTSVEPVNATLSTSGCCASSSPALPPGPVIKLTTPGGMSASCTAFTISIALSDVKLAAFLARHLGPRAVVEGLARGLNGALGVFPAGLGHVGDLLARRGCVGGEGLAGFRVGPDTIDEQLRVAHRDSSQRYALLGRLR